jgi:hypothetical protein
METKTTVLHAAARGRCMGGRNIARISSRQIVISTGMLAVMCGASVSAQDKYTLQVPNGLAFSDFKGYEDWQIVSVSQTTPTGRPRTTSSPTPTPLIKCSTGSGPRIAATSPPSVGSCTGRWPPLSQCPACAHPGRGQRTTRRPANRYRDDPRHPARCLRPTTTGRSRGKAGDAAFLPGPSAGTADRHPCAVSAPRGRVLSCLSDARSRGSTVLRLGRHRRGPAYSDCGRPLSRGAFADPNARRCRRLTSSDA